MCSSVDDGDDQQTILVLHKADPYVLPVHFSTHMLLPVNADIAYGEARKHSAYVLLRHHAAVEVSHTDTCMLRKDDIHAMTIRYPNAVCQAECISR